MVKGSRKKRHDYVGQTFGRWHAVSPAILKNGRYGYVCVCVCGEKKIVDAASLKRGDSLSCGCINKEKLSAMSKTHGKKGSKIYSVWEGIIKRCENKNARCFKNYGGRGIRVCEEWKNSFVTFYNDMGDVPDGKEIDRIDNDKGYSKNNCRWVDKKTNMRNTRRNVFVSVKNTTLCVTDWALITGIRESTIRYRLSVGINPEWLFCPTNIQNGRGLKG